MKRNHNLLEYTRDNDTQVSELGPSGPSCMGFRRNETFRVQRNFQPMCNLYVVCRFEWRGYSVPDQKIVSVKFLIKRPYHALHVSKTHR